GTAGTRLAGDADRRPELALRLEEGDGDLAFGGQAVELAPAVAGLAVVAEAPEPPRDRHGVRDDPGEDVCLRDGLPVGVDDPGLHGDPPADRDVDLAGVAAGTQVAVEEGVGVPAHPARLALIND